MGEINIEKSWVYLNQLVYQFHEEGNIESATNFAKQALKLARLIYPDFKEHNNLATSINNLALLYQNQGEISEAKSLYIEALEIRRRLFLNHEHNDLATSINNLAALYELQGEVSAAKALYIEALEVRRRLFLNHEHNDLATSINNLAALYELDGETSMAEPLYIEALEIRRRLCSNMDDNCLATSINNLAHLYIYQGQINLAEPLYLEALAMMRRLFKDRDHKDLATTIDNLGYLYLSQGKINVAESLYEESLNINRRLFKDRDHHDLAASINNAATLYQSQGKYSKAESLYAETLGIMRRLFEGCDHKDLATSIDNLAASYQSQGKYSAAQPLCIEALLMYRRLFADRDHQDLAVSINNLAALYEFQGELSKAEVLYEESLAIYRRLFVNFDHYSLATSINNLAFLYISQNQLKKAFSLIIEAVEVEENMLRQWFGYSTESNRLNFMKGNQTRLEVLVSLLYQYFPDDSEKIAQVAIMAARRKAFAAQAEVELNYLRYSDRYPDLAEDFLELATAQGKLTHLNHTYYHHQGAMDKEAREFHQQVKQTLTEQIDQLERHLSANVPELRQLQQHVTLTAIFAALPDNSCVIEFYRFDMYSFAVNGWQDPQYVAFIFAPGGNVSLIKLGEAGGIDELINRYRDFACDVNLPSFGARPDLSNPQSQPMAAVEDLSIDRQLSQQLLTPILPTIGAEIKHLIFIPDGALNFLPIGNLPVGGCLNDRFVCTYLSTLRELLTSTDRPSPALNPPIAIGNPNYDYPDSAMILPAAAGVSSLLSMMTQAGARFSPIPESELLLEALRGQLTSDAQFFTQDRATTNVLQDAKAPKSLVIVTHGYAPNGKRDRINLILRLRECPEGEELDLIQAYSQLIDRSFMSLLNAMGDWLEAQSTNGGNFCRSLGKFLRRKFPELVNRESGQLIDPMQNHGLALAGANTWLEGKELPTEIGKGFLLARDVAYLDLLGTEIVFLIACSSGLGYVKTGEGVFGLRRAFAIAGVKQLITSLWDVPTYPTLLLTDKFFEVCQQGMEPAIALQTAQHYIRDISRSELASIYVGKKVLDELSRYGIQIPDPNHPLHHPYFWGAWICQGV
jgi:CHAT domain-containing protein/tetratricopeptide (TPR) repeat protein